MTITVLQGLSLIEMRLHNTFFIINSTIYYVKVQKIWMDLGSLDA